MWEIRASRLREDFAGAYKGAQVTEGLSPSQKGARRLPRMSGSACPAARSLALTPAQLPSALPAQANCPPCPAPGATLGKQPRGRTEGHGLICTLGKADLSILSLHVPLPPQTQDCLRAVPAEGAGSWLVTSVWVILGAALCQVYTIPKHCHGNFS